MPQIMQPHVDEQRRLAYPRPGLSEIDEVLAGLAVANQVRVALQAGQRGQNVERRRVEVDDLLARLRIGQREGAAPQVYPLPPRLQDFASPGADKEQQADRPGRPRGDGGRTARPPAAPGPAGGVPS